MKTFLFLFCTTVFSFTSNNVFSQNEKIKIDADKMLTADEIFLLITKQTDYCFIYHSDLFKDLPKVSVKKGTIKANKLLLQTLSEGKFIFELSANKTIAIKEKLKISVVQQTITGKVTDVDGEPLPGVNVLVGAKGITKVRGVATDFDGKYSIEASAGEVIRFSYVSYVTQEFTVTDQNIINVVLLEDTASLDEVVLVSTGYQTLPKERVAGSFVEINEDYIQEHPSINLATVLDASSSGIRTEVDVDGNVDFIIRGVSTLNASSQPLLVVDGFAIEGGIETINPNNVKTINILKDAAAASIWGARSTNGVIVITTKDGSTTSKDKIDVRFNSFITFSNKLNMDYAYPVASPTEQLEWEEYLSDISLTDYSGALEFSNLGINSSLGNTLIAQKQKGLITQQEYNNLRSQLLTNNYQSDVEDYLLNSPLYNHHDVSISGRSDKMDYVLSGMYESGEGKFIGQEENKAQIGFKANFKITKWLNFYTDLRYRKEKNKSNGLTLDEITSIPSYSKILNDDGSYFNQVAPILFDIAPTVSYVFQPAQREFFDNAGFAYDWNYNLLREAKARDFNLESNYVRIQTGINAKLMEGLSWDLKGQYERRLSYNRLLTSDDAYAVRARINTLTPYDLNTNEVTGISSYPAGDVLQQTNGDLRNYTLRTQLNFIRSFGIHQVAAVAGTEFSSTVTDNKTPAIVYGYDRDKLTSKYPVNGYDGLDNFRYSARESYTSITNGQNFFYTDKRLFSAFFNGSYTYNQKYTLQTSIRTDASNVIVEDPKYRYSPFWSVGTAWNIKSESFLTEVDWLNRLKFRMTYGETGNIVNTASTVPTISHTPASYSIDYQSYATITDYGNPSLRWEKTGTFNAAVDFGILSNSVMGTLEFYNKHGRDIIGRVDLPVATGVSSQQFNLAEIRNYGFDFNIKFDTKLTSRINWRNEFNISYNNNEVLSLRKGSYASSTLIQPHFEEGKPSNAIFSYDYLGMIDGAPQIAGVNGNNFLLHYPPGVSDAHSYMKYSGSTTPNWYGGWLMGFNTQRFTFLVKLKAEFGHVFRTPTFQYRGPGTKALHEDASLVLAESDTDRIPGLPLENEENIYLWNRFVPFFDTLIADASYLRLQEIYTSYNLTDIINIKGINQLEMFLQARNLGLLWSANKQNLDPVYIIEKPLTNFTIGLRFGI